MATKTPTTCPHCDIEMSYAGTKKFHEGIRAWAFILGDPGELFTNREHFDIYICRNGGKVELFVDGIGENYRPH